MYSSLLQWYYRVFSPVIPPGYHDFLQKYVPYYQNLIPEEQVRFRHRLFVLLRVLTWHGRGFPVYQEMKLLIGSAFIQVSFGLDWYLPRRFQDIIIVPSAYHYPGFRQPFLGHVDLQRELVCLSWPHVKHSFFIPDDSFNVALHEVAHVLEAEYGYLMLRKRLFQRVHWHQWRALAKQKLYDIRADRHRFLKDYGGTNMRELFAVSIEAFFEQPVTFKQQLPELYEALCQLLNQDPSVRAEPVGGGL